MLNLNAEEGTPEAARQRKMLLAGLAGVALLVVLGAVFVLPGLFGGASDTSAVVAVPHHSVKPSAKPSAAVTPTPTSSPSAEAVAASGRDPFAKLPQEVVASTAGSSTGATAGTSTDAGTATATTGTATTGTTATGTTAGTAPAASSTTSSTSTPSSTTASGTTSSSDIAGKPVQYMSFAGAGAAKIEIDSTPYTVEDGQTVAGYSVVSVSSSSVKIAHGTTTKTLALGELQTF